jgi:hypothetical protein
MNAIPPTNPATPQDYLDAWRTGTPISVPSRSGKRLGLTIERVYETTRVNGLPLDLLIEARASKRAPPRQFGVIFSDAAPRQDYPIEVLWICAGKSAWLG